MNAKTKLENIFLEFCNKNHTILQIESFLEKLEKGYKVVLFGTGNQGLGMLRTLNSLKIDISYFCDNNSTLWGGYIKGIKCISPSELLKIKNVVVCISSSYIEQISQQLKSIGIKDIYTFGEFTMKLTISEINEVLKNRHKFLEVLDLLEDNFSKDVYIAAILQWFNGILQFPKELISNNQYFDKNIYKFSDNEVMIDCGAYDGDTIDRFCEETNNIFNEIYAFELNPFNYEKLLKNIMKKNISSKVHCFNKGVGNINGKISLQNDDTASRICDNSISDVFGEICRLDDTIEYASLIKMDVEGAELDALKGAEYLIKLCKPKLAICIYHRPSDFYEIPLYIKKLVPEYKFAIRHYTSVETETVLYAFL